MTKDDVVKRVHLTTTFSREQADLAVRATLDALSLTLVEAAKTGQNLQLRGLGTFQLVQTKARTRRNPQTGAQFTAPAGRKFRFVPGAYLKGELDGDADRTVE